MERNQQFWLSRAGAQDRAHNRPDFPLLHAQQARLRMMPQQAPEPVEVQMSFHSTRSPSVVLDARDDDDMRSERLTRKSHFRRINLQDTDIGADVIDHPSSDGDKLWALADLAEDALGCDLEELYRQSPSFLHRYDALLWATQMIHQSPTARMLLDAAANNGWAVSFSDLKNQGFCMDQEERIIYVDHFCLDASALGKSAGFSVISC